MVIIWTIKIWNISNFGGLKPLFTWLNYWTSPACGLIARCLIHMVPMNKIGLNLEDLFDIKASFVST